MARDLLQQVVQQDAGRDGSRAKPVAALPGPGSRGTMTKEDMTTNILDDKLAQKLITLGVREHLIDTCADASRGIGAYVDALTEAELLAFASGDAVIASIVLRYPGGREVVLPVNPATPDAG